MRFDELKVQVKTCSFEETRVDNNDLFEAVFRKTESGNVIAKLNAVFGAPAWPSENKLPEEAHNIIQGYGGIMSGQTLFFTHLEEGPVFAMLWPWGDKDHITLKMGRKGK